MRCPKCSKENRPDDVRCLQCGSSLAVALLEVIRGSVAEKIHFLRGRSYTLGRARHNDLCLNEPSVSKGPARILYDHERFHIEDQGSPPGVYGNPAKGQKTELTPGAQAHLGNPTLTSS